MKLNSIEQIDFGLVFYFRCVAFVGALCPFERGHDGVLITLKSCLAGARN